MYHYRYCNPWSRRYAHAFHKEALHKEACEEAQPEKPCYESRQHRRGNFGVRRPLRYLSYQLDLDEQQRRSVAAVLDGLKLEREQGKLDEKRTVTELAALVTREELSVDELRRTLAPRVQSAENLQIVIAKAVQEIVAILDVDQREEFAHLLRSGAVNL